MKWELPKPKYENSAGRLLTILQVGRNGKACLHAIPKSLGVELPHANSNDESAQVVYEFFSEVHRLYHEFLKDMEGVDGPEKDVLLNGLAGLPKHMSPLQLNGACSVLSEAEASLLEVCAAKLSTEETLTEDDIARIRSCIDELRRVIDESRISRTLEKALLDLCRIAEDAISRYEIRGAKGVRDGRVSMVGELMLIYRDQNKDSISDEVWWQKAVNLAHVLDLVVTRLCKYKSIGVTTVKLLGWTYGSDEVPNDNAA